MIHGMSARILRNGRLIDGTGRTWAHADIRVENDGIGAVSQERLEDEKVESVDLAGWTIVPGLMNCHAHICGAPIDQPPGSTSTQRIAQHAVRAAGWLEQALQQGVTAIRDLGGIEHIELALKRMVEKRAIAGPRIRAAGRQICMTGGHGCYSGGIETDGPDEVRRAVRAQLKAGADVIKVMATGGIMTPGTQPAAAQLSPAELAVAVEEAHKAGRTVAAHAEGRDGIRNAILAGVDSIEHGYELDDELIELMLERGTFLCPTLTCDLFIAEHGAEVDLPPDAVEKMKRWIEPLLTSFRRADRAGVRIAAGNDGFAEWVPIGGMARELAAMIKYGMDPHQALIAATANSAELLQLPDEGVIGPGKRANLVVLDGDPLLDIDALTRVIAVMKDGDWVGTPPAGTMQKSA
jgi:imidazolonepropionase-like amidohydrolase